MIRKLLIANRGEIACRIARTARAMGIRTVAVHSEADRGALHLRACDEAIEIGPAPAAESYLGAVRILEAARMTGADAVHPGYGFLSETPDFAEAVEAAGLIWVGPPASAIRAMGLKDEAKRRMEEAGVPVTPGYHGAEQALGFLAERAAEIGYPILIKAAAGGGGKGMRRVDRAEAFAEALAGATREAQSAFGNPRVLIEKFIENPRHIEVQVFADAHGSAVHLYERDCSAQRRHQKVLEEAPAPGMTEPLRGAMTDAAIRAAEAVGYVGAGTVEFIVDGERMAPDGFFFMEMNTRLQVEHPVTEAVTGLDLVEWQLRVAAGEPLPLGQDAIALRGHAVEVRLYAEDPARDFMPQTGRLDRLVWPEGTGLRIDTGVAEGDRITPHYDPMIAKLIAHGETRAAAFQRMGEALAGTDVAGSVTNLGFLERLLTEPGMAAGDVDTGLIGRAIGDLTEIPRPVPGEIALGAAALGGLLAPGPMAGWRAWGRGRTHLSLMVGEETHEVALIPRPGGVTAELGGTSLELGLRQIGATGWEVAQDGRSRQVHLHLAAGRVALAAEGRRVTLGLADPLARSAAAEAGSDEITSPLPGRVVQVAVEPGAEIAEGALLAVVEAMKMEHSLRAHRAGRVAEVLARAGDQVAEGALLVTLEPQE